MKKILTIMMTVLAIGAQAALTVNYSSGYGEPDVRKITGAPAPEGMPVGLGLFPLGYDPMAAASAEELMLNWIRLDSTPLREIFGEPAHFAGTAYFTDPGLDNRRIWLAIGGEEWGYYGVFSGQPEDEWVYTPDDGSTIFNTASPSTSSADTAAWGYIGAQSLVLVHVPEPATLALAVFGLILLVASRWWIWK